MNAIMTQWDFGAISASAEIDKMEVSNDGYINYTATVSLGDTQGFDRFGPPVTVHHTAYIVDGRLASPSDAQDFEVLNDDLAAAYGVFAQSRLRDIVIAAIEYAAKTEYAAMGTV